VFARVPYAEFEERNEGQKQNIIAISKFFLFLFDGDDVSATNAFEKITVTSDRNNNSRASGRSPQPPEANGSLRAEAPTLRRFSRFFQKIKHFYACFGLNICLESWF